MPDEITPQQYYEIKSALRDLEGKVSATAMTVNTIQEAIDGKGREQGMRHDLRDLRTQMDGRPPKYEDGVAYAIKLLTENQTSLSRKFDAHVDEQTTSDAGRSGRWTGARTVWAIIIAVLGFIGTMAGVFVAVQRALASVIGGG